MAEARASHPHPRPETKRARRKPFEREPLKDEASSNAFVTRGRWTAYVRLSSLTSGFVSLERLTYLPSFLPVTNALRLRF